MIRLSVIVRCYNAADTLGETLDGLVSQQWDKSWEIVLSDNGSTDNSVEIFETCARNNPGVVMRVVDASQRKGRPHAANVGVEAARGRSVTFCDADDVVAPGWLKAMGDALETHDFVGARVDTAKLNPGWIREYRGYPDTGVSRLPHPPYNLSAGGGTMGFRRAIFKRVGGFDPKFPVCEDAEFCVRVHLLGVPFHYVPNAVTHVRYRADLKGLVRQAYTWSLFDVKLSRRYRDLAPPQDLRWQRFFRKWRLLGRWYLATRILNKPRSMSEMAKNHWDIGWALGQLVGIVKYQVPPTTGLPPDRTQPAEPTCLAQSST